eukprot:scaffold98949_cov32-Tisochrysis_lutea.AAC.5
MFWGDVTAVFAHILLALSLVSASTRRDPTPLIAVWVLFAWCATAHNSPSGWAPRRSDPVASESPDHDDRVWSRSTFLAPGTHAVA